MDYAKLDEIKELDYKYALTLVANMKPLYEKILKMFVETKFPEFCKNLNELPDGEDFTTEIHSLKSNLKQLGLTEFGEIAQDIESNSKTENYQYCRDKLPNFLDQLGVIVEKLKSAF